MAIYSGFSHEKLWFSIAMLNYQWVIDIWAIKNTPIPSHYTSQLLVGW